MSNQDDILKQLRDFPVTPPPGMYKTISAQLNLSGTIEEEDILPFSRLTTHEVAPPSFLFNSIKNLVEEENSIIDKTVAQLKDYSALAPSQAFAAIWKAIQKGWDTAHAPVRPIYSIFKEYRSIAAAAIIIIAITFFVNDRRTVTPERTIVKTEKIIAPVEITDTLIEDVQPEVFAKSAVVPPATLSEGLRSLFYAENEFYSENFYAGEKSFQIVDDDLLFTFASFTQADVPDFLKNKSSKRYTIRVDAYTSIAISVKMQTMMKYLYKTRKNGNPTARARREKRKLEKWRKADIKRFDEKLSANPLDPLDLGEYLY